MKLHVSFGVALLSGMCLLGSAAQAQNLLTNGNLDQTYQQEIVPGFFLPKPANWVNEGSRTIGGPYEDEMSSEPWAGPAPTPVTTGDRGVFFKPFTGGATTGPATGHFYQDVAGMPGMTYTLTGWAGAEANAMMLDAQFAIEFLDSSGNLIPLHGSVLSLLPTLKTSNGLPFNYKQYTVSALAPAGTAQVRARASMIGATSNPLGGGQAFVIDDFELTAVPEPTTLGLLAIAGGFVAKRRKKA